MTVRSQLHACRDSLMAGMRSAARGTTPNVRAGVVLRACLDLVETHLAQQTADVLTSADVAMTLAVVDRAVEEFREDPDTPHAIVTALQSAAERLASIRVELETV